MTATTLPQSRQEVLAKDIEQGERTRKARAGREQAQAKARVNVAQHSVPMTQEDVDEYEGRRLEHLNKVRAKTEKNRAAFEAERLARENDPATWQGGPEPS